MMFGIIFASKVGEYNDVAIIEHVVAPPMPEIVVLIFLRDT